MPLVGRLIRLAQSAPAQRALRKAAVNAKALADDPKNKERIAKARAHVDAQLRKRR